MLSNQIGALSLNNSGNLISNVPILDSMVPSPFIQDPSLGRTTDSPDLATASIFSTPLISISTPINEHQQLSTSAQNIYIHNPYSYIPNDHTYPSQLSQQIYPSIQYCLPTQQTYFNSNTIPLEYTSPNHLFLKFPYPYSTNRYSITDINDNNAKS